MRVLFLGILSLLLSTCYSSVVVAQITTHIDVPASEELYCIHFDKSGLLWMGTSAGIKSYDGYTLREAFAEAIPSYPQLTGDIRSLTTDNNQNLWAGTNNGLVRICLKDGQTKTYKFPKQSQQIIYKLFTTRDGTVFAGTDDGFSVYHKEKDEFTHYNVDKTKALFPDGKTDRYTGWGVKDFIETKDGDILIGTWNQGLWRYSPKTDKIRGYAQLNWMNSAFTLSFDHRDRLWIGTTSNGVQRIDRTDDYQLSTLKSIEDGSEFVNFNHQKVVYGLTELTDGRFFISAGDTIAAVKGPDGAFWVATRGNGIERLMRPKYKFSSHADESIRNLYSPDGIHFFLGYGMEGLAWIDTSTGETRKNNQVPGFSSLPSDGFSPRITSMIQRYNGELWFAAGDNGILISRPDGSSEIRYANSRQMPFVKDNVTALCETAHDHTLWIGQRQGVSFLLENGKGIHLNVKNDTLDMTGYFMVNHIMEDHNENIWISTVNNGIVKVTGNPEKTESLTYRHYTSQGINITACFEDSRHRIWAIGPNGLLLFSPEKDCFNNTESSFHLNGKKALAINEDPYGNLWIATERAMVRLDNDFSTISFTKEDGLSSTTFFPNSTCRFGNRLFFGTANGFIGFEPQPTYDDKQGKNMNLILTDIIIDGNSITTLDSLDASEITKELATATQIINIPASVKKFTFEFALLSYANQEETQYAYQLEGYDKEWQYVDGTSHHASFDHVPPGNYTFRLKAADSRGIWHELPYDINVKVYAPWYETWWAYLIYICLIYSIAYFAWKYIRMQRELEASRRFSTILQSTQIHVDSANGSSVSDGQNHPDSEADKATQEKHSNPIQQRNAEFIARATQLVRDNMEDSDYNRDRMAADLGMSVSSLYARLRECTDLSIQTFIQTIRLNTACDILRREPDIRISELAYRVGFNTPKYFSQCFKREFGMLPGDYIKQ